MKSDDIIEIPFELDSKEGWPPFNVEWLWCRNLKNEIFIIESSPYFIKNLSKFDMVCLNFDDNKNVVSWKLLKESDHSTIWMMTFEGVDCSEILKQFANIGCRIETLEAFSLSSIDVPGHVSYVSVDEIIDSVDGDDRYCFAFPCDRQSPICN